MRSSATQGAPAHAPTPLPLCVNTIPDELKQRPQWVCWGYEWRRGLDGKGKWTKPPYTPTTGDYAKSNDPTTWGTFEAAVKPPEIDDLPAIGYMFQKDDPYVGIDLDLAWILSRAR